jgi:hypothetical protein
MLEHKLLSALKSPTTQEMLNQVNLSLSISRSLIGVLQSFFSDLFIFIYIIMFLVTYLYLKMTLYLGTGNENNILQLKILLLGRQR